MTSRLLLLEVGESARFSLSDGVPKSDTGGPTGTTEMPQRLENQV